MEEVLKSWNIQVTETLLDGLEAARANRLEQDRQLKQSTEDK